MRAPKYGACSRLPAFSPAAGSSPPRCVREVSRPEQSARHARLHAVVTTRARRRASAGLAHGTGPAVSARRNTVDVGAHVTTILSRRARNFVASRSGARSTRGHASRNGLEVVVVPSAATIHEGRAFPRACVEEPPRHVGEAAARIGRELTHLPAGRCGRRALSASIARLEDGGFDASRIARIAHGAAGTARFALAGNIVPAPRVARHAATADAIRLWTSDAPVRADLTGRPDERAVIGRLALSLTLRKAGDALAFYAFRFRAGRASIRADGARHDYGTIPIRLARWGCRANRVGSRALAVRTAVLEDGRFGAARIRGIANGACSSASLASAGAVKSTTAAISLASAASGRDGTDDGDNCGTCEHNPRIHATNSHRRSPFGTERPVALHGSYQRDEREWVQGGVTLNGRLYWQGAATIASNGRVTLTGWFQ